MIRIVVMLSVGDGDGRVELWQSDGENAVFHGGHHTIGLGMGRDRETIFELQDSAVEAAAGVAVFFCFHHPLSAHLKHSFVFYLHLQFLPPQPRHLALQHFLNL
ncbi:uncharacterized protein HKW66_Vig0177200 [Vigna angularis]|uniref:Uncharacterized protein n=1 Tax=Phaseolus angularis TaxID=3914 RepID=A0A8T0JY50_PHAAN|nr:uncharacterized protein HKW66_Vig0177200 [Vigna angularis]